MDTANLSVNLVAPIFLMGNLCPDDPPSLRFFFSAFRSGLPRGHFPMYLHTNFPHPLFERGSLFLTGGSSAVFSPLAGVCLKDLPPVNLVLIMGSAGVPLTVFFRCPGPFPPSTVFLALPNGAFPSPTMSIYFQVPPPVQSTSCNRRVFPLFPARPPPPSLFVAAF